MVRWRAGALARAPPALSRRCDHAPRIELTADVPCRVGHAEGGVTRDGIEARAGELFHSAAEPHDRWVVGAAAYVPPHSVRAGGCAR